MARIITVYSARRGPCQPTDMSFIRWLKISEALAELGHRVDMATPEFRWRLRKPVVEMEGNLRRVPISRVDWGDYDVVKTLFHEGFLTLERYGGTRHPRIISKLGSVVGPHDMEGIYFYGKRRRALYAVQEKISETARWVTVLTPQAQNLWVKCFGARPELLIVPGAAERNIPPAGRDPYPEGSGARCLFAGNFYQLKEQPEANRTLVEKFNILGRLLQERDARLFLLGSGETRDLDRRYVTHLEAVPYEESWDYLHFADIGLVLSAGDFMHNNESTKIYHYLRAGLPVVSESGFPNDGVVHASGLGFVVPAGQLQRLADKVEEARTARWDREGAVRYILEHHTWYQRARVYEERVLRPLTKR